MPPLFVRLVDDAGLFPPEALAMPAAVARHRGDLASHQPVLSGRFVCPATRLDELLAELEPGERMAVSVVTPLEADPLEQDVARLAGEDRVTLAAVEGPLGDPAALAAVPAGLPCYAEIPVTGDWRPGLDVLARSGHAAKVRCGGARPDLFPTAAQLGALVHACARDSVPFKATAGLHHALPYRDAHTGLQHHGFLNLLLAVCRAVDGADPGAVTDVLTLTQAGRLAGEARAVSAGLAARARSLLRGYGSCSTSEPVEDLRRLGLLTVAGPA